MSDCDRFQTLISGYLDGELTQQDRQRVELHLESCSGCESTFNELLELRTSVGQMSFGELSVKEQETIMNSLSVRASRGLGWILLSLGVAIGLGYAFWIGGWELLEDSSIPFLVRLAILGPYAGLVLLLISVAIQRLKERRTDPYKDVKR